MPFRSEKMMPGWSGEDFILCDELPDSLNGELTGLDGIEDGEGL